MKNLFKVTLISALGLLFSCEKDEANTANLDSNVVTSSEVLNNTVSSFDVYVELVDGNGKSVSADTLPGYSATNLETNEIYYDSRYEIGLFESLPVGTYKFSARDGYFDGAYSTTVEVVSENETSEGWVVATLEYWSE